MNCTVIGASGFIGARLLAGLRAAGHTVYAPARGPQGSAPSTAAPLEAALSGRDLGKVFYCAGLTADYAARPFETVEAHVSLLARLLEQGRFEHLVYLSSTRLYDGNGGVQAVGVEDADLNLNPANPRHLFDLSKALGEHLCLCASGGRAAVARLSCIVDWRDGAPGFLSEWMQRAARERAFTLDSASGLVRDYLHVDDAVAALLAMAQQGAQGIVNVASGENVSNAELAEVFNARGWAVTLARQTERQSAPQCDVRRLNALGVQPRPVRAWLETYLSKELLHGTV